MNDLNLVVSLTTWSKRIETKILVPVLQSLINQVTTLKYKIEIVVTQSDKLLLDNYAEFQDLVKSSPIKIEVTTTRIDLKSHNKYFYTMQKYKRLPVLTVDDDIIYDSNLIDTLWKTYSDHPNCIVASRVDVLTYDTNRKINPYDQWKHECWDVKVPSFDVYATGVGGILYPPDILKISNSDLDDILYRYTKDDDTFLKFKSISVGAKTILCDTNKRMYHPIHEVSEDFALCKVNFHGGMYHTWTSNMIEDIENTINICMITDKAYVDLTTICINSIIETKDDKTRINFYVIGDKLEQSDLSKMFRFDNNKIRLQCFSTDSDKLITNVTIHRYLSNTMYVKFFIPKFMKHLDKILYLDSDILVKKDLREFYNSKLDNDQLIGAVKDFGLVNIWKNGRTTDFYSGQMLMDLKKLREFDFTTKCLNQHKLTNEADQEIINKVCLGKVKYLSPKYCFSYHKIIENDFKEYQDINKWNDTYNTEYQSVDELKNDSVIWHFHGNKKEQMKNSVLKSIFNEEWIKTLSTLNIQRRLPRIYLFSNCDHHHNNEEYESLLREKVVPIKGDKIFFLNTCQPLKMAFNYFDYLKWKKEVEINVVMRAFWFRGIYGCWGLESIVRNPAIYTDLYALMSGPSPELKVIRGTANVQDISSTVNWSFVSRYPFEGKYVSPTSGFLVTNILEQFYGNDNVVLVDFYGDLDNSSQKTVDHNWIYENEWLKTKNRIFI